jgi:phenol/toluene 2-monooxygenase (NADH) P0/A0
MLAAVGNEGIPNEAFDTNRRFVRVVEHRADGFVEFRFAIGEPSLFVEMMLSEAAFAEFCSLNHAEPLEPLPAGGETGVDDIDDWDWTLHDAVQRRFR